MSHRITCHQVSLQTPDLEAGQHFARHLGQEYLDAGGGGGVRLDEGPHEDHPLEAGALGGEGGEQGDQAAHGVADQEEREPGPGVRHLPAQLDEGPGELLHVPHHHPLPLALPVTHVVEAKHEEAALSAGLGQLGVVRHEVLRISGGVMRQLSGNIKLNIKHRPVREEHQASDVITRPPGECFYFSPLLIENCSFFHS